MTFSEDTLERLEFGRIAKYLEKIKYIQDFEDSQEQFPCPVFLHYATSSGGLVRGSHCKPADTICKELSINNLLGSENISLKGIIFQTYLEMKLENLKEDFENIVEEAHSPRPRQFREDGGALICEWRPEIYGFPYIALSKPITCPEFEKTSLSIFNSFLRRNKEHKVFVSKKKYIFISQETLIEIINGNFTVGLTSPNRNIRLFTKILKKDRDSASFKHRNNPYDQST